MPWTLTCSSGRYCGCSCTGVHCGFFIGGDQPADDYRTFVVQKEMSEPLLTGLDILERTPTDQRLWEYFYSSLQHLCHVVKLEFR